MNFGRAWPVVAAVLFTRPTMTVRHDVAGAEVHRFEVVKRTRVEAGASHRRILAPSPPVVPVTALLVTSRPIIM